MNNTMIGAGLSRSAALRATVGRLMCNRYAPDVYTEYTIYTSVLL